MTFEEVIQDSLPQTDQILKASKKGTSAVAACCKHLAEGDLRSLARRLEDAEEFLQLAAKQIASFRKSWQGDELSEYFGTEGYLEELFGYLREYQVNFHLNGEVLYVYPVLVRFDKEKTALKVNRKADPRVGPQMLARRLKDLQDRPSKFPVSRFLRSLFRVYKALASANLKRSEPWAGRSLPLRDIYNLLSASPGNEYSEQEFVRDLYLLDSSGEPLEVGDYVATLQASSGTRDEKKTMSIITRDGQRKLYCSIRFDPIAR